MPHEPITTRPLDGPRERMANPYQRPGRMGRPIPVVIFDHPRERMPKEYIGGRSAGRYKEVDNLRRKRKPNRCGQARKERIAPRAIEWLAKMGLMVLIAASLGIPAGAPRSDRPEDATHLAPPLLLDDAPDHRVPGDLGSESPFLAWNRASDPEMGKTKPKMGGIVMILPTRTLLANHPTDQSRGPPGPGFDPSSADRSPSEPSDAGRSRPRAPEVGTVRPGGRDTQPLEPLGQISDNNKRSCNRRSSRAGPPAHPGPPPTRT